MDEQENDYQKLVKLIDEVEAVSVKSDSSFIDLSGTMEQMQMVKSKSYREMLEMIESVEGGRRIRETPGQMLPPQQPPMPQPRPAKQQKQRIEEPRVEAPSPSPVQFTQNEIATPEIPSALEADRKKESVANELSQMAKRFTSLTPSIREFTRKKINVKDLVLPNLSIADQISELERIIEGLNERVFDSEHIPIVAQEVYGLRQVVADEKKKMKSKQQGVQSLEESLWELRDQRLAEASSLLEQSGAG
jgi:hypothetical protein